MRNYEIMFIVRPDVEESVVKSTVKSLEKVLTDRKAKITLSKELTNNAKALTKLSSDGNTEVKKDLEGNFEFTLAPLSFALLQNGEHFE